MLLIACQPKQAEPFINDEATKKRAHEIIKKEAKTKFGISLKPTTIGYASKGKSTNYNKIYVNYTTVEKPIYRGRGGYFC